MVITRRLDSVNGLIGTTSFVFQVNELPEALDSEVTAFVWNIGPLLLPVQDV